MQSKIFFYVLFFLIWIPFIQIHIFLKAIPGLHGSSTLHAKPALSFDTWFSGEYQQDFEQFMNDNIGCRPFFVRLKNQIYFSLFKKINVERALIGKNDFLYEQDYINAYNGLDFIGAKAIQEKVEKIAMLQKKLQEHNITLIVAMAPSKGSFHPEYFPTKFSNKKPSPKNHFYFNQYFQEKDINFIDFDTWFLKKKKDCACPLFPQYGIHWSNYGSTLATDSLIRYIEIKKQINLSNIKVDTMQTSYLSRGDDYDIANAMNLLVDLKTTTPLCYPVIEWKNDGKTTKPKVLTIGDSFYWGIFKTGIAPQSFGTGDFWFYNNQVYSASNNEPYTSVEKLNLKAEILRNDLIIIISSEPNIVNIGWGFIDQALAVL